MYKRQISLYVFLKFFATRILRSSICKVSLSLRFFKPLLLHRTRLFSLIKVGCIFESKILVALLGRGYVLTHVLVLLRFVQLATNFAGLPDPSLQGVGVVAVTVTITLALLTRALEFFVRFFKFCDLCGQLRLTIVTLAWRVLIARIALLLCTFPSAGSLRSTVVLILMAIPRNMGILHAPMLLA